MSAEATETAAATRELAEFAAAVELGDVPRPVVERAKLCLLDTLGCALFGQTLPWTEIVLETALALDQGGPAPVWGTDASLTAPNAALVNGAAVHAFEIDDLHRASIVHPGAVVTPAAFAVASGLPGASGADLLTALVVGYEVAARVGMTVGSAHLKAGWHPTGTHGALGAAAAAASVLGLDAAATHNALGCAGSMSAGLMAAQFESMVKRLHAGRAAQSGVFAALLAQRGYVGIAALFEAPYGGYCATFSPTHDLAPLTAGLGREWEAGKVGFKAYSCNGSCHPTVEMLAELRRNGLDHTEVEAVEVGVSTATMEHVGWPYEPSTVTTAQMNLPYIAASVLVTGAAFVDAFAEDRLADPVLLELAGRVHVRVDEEIDAMGDEARHLTRLEVVTKGGERLRAEQRDALGSPGRPLPESAIRSKFRDLAGRRLAAAAVERIEAAVMSFDEREEAGELTRLLSR